MSEIAKLLEEFTAANSSFETSRNYLSISHCADPVEKQIETHFRGFEDSIAIRLRCYKGYQTERDLVGRIKKVFTDRVETGYEISVHGGLVKGHPDFLFDGLPADCKSVPNEEHLPFATESKQIPRKVYWQMQGYLFYMQKPKGLLVYEVRDTGKIMDYWVYANHSLGQTIDENFRKVISEIDNRSLKSA
jgi:hypothetical protein